MNKGIKEEVDNISLNLLISRNMENAYFNNFLDLQKLNNLYSVSNNSLYANLNSLPSIQTSYNPSLIMSSIQNLGNLNSLISFSNSSNQAQNYANLGNFANFSNIAKFNNQCNINNNNNNNNENTNFNSSNFQLNQMKSNDEKAFNYIGQQTVY